MLAAILVLLTFSSALAAAGSLDPTFGTNGVIITDLGIDSTAAGDIALTIDGKFYISSSAQLDEFNPYAKTQIILRYNSDGSLDHTYGVDGIVPISNVETISGGRFIIQPDGKSLRCGNIGQDFAVIRYNTDGTLDDSFGTNGIGTMPQSGGDITNHCADFAIQPDRKIIVFGTETSQSNYNDWVIGRFNSDGTPDITFGQKVVDHFPAYSRYNYASAVVIQTDGKIMLSGSVYNDYANPYGPQISLARLNNDGTYDTSFGAGSANGTIGMNGTVTTIYSRFYGTDMALQADGKIVVIGYKTTLNDADTEDFAIARFNTDGTLDTAFGTAGFVLTDFGYDDRSNDLVIQKDGRIIVVGRSESWGGVLGAYGFIMARYNTNGTLDTTFGVNGKVIGNFGSNYEFANDAVLQSDGKLLVTGSANHDMLVARYDTGSFGFSKQSPVNGVTGIDPTSVTLSWDAVAPSPQGYGQSYKYCYYTSGGTCNFSSNLYTTHSTLPALKLGTTYYWQVEVVTCMDASCTVKDITPADDGQVWSFTTVFPANVISKQSPANGVTGIDPSNVTLSWDAAGSNPYGQSYKFCYYASGGTCNFSPNIYTTHSALPALAGGTTYYWQVEVITCMDASCTIKDTTPANGGKEWSFTTSFFTVAYDDTDGDWTYSGAWTAVTTTGPYNGTDHRTNDLSATASFTFTGTRFAYLYVIHPSRGRIGVWVDGNLVTTINANGTLKWQATYISPAFAAGTHTVVFKNASSSTGYYIDVDAIKILTTYDDPDAGWTYSGAWAAVTPTGPYNNTDHRTNDLNATASFTFTGTRFIYYYVVHPSRGQIGVWVDGNLVTTINANGTLQWQSTYVSPILAAGTHTVVFKNASSSTGYYIDVDAIKILTTYDDPDAGWTYTGSWTALSSMTGPYNGTDHRTNDLSATASFTFNGTGFVYYYVTHTSRGQIGVWVDGNYVTTINANGTLQYQARYVSPMFASGTHTVVFKNASTSTGYYIDVDAISIVP